jgi:hypothetical protein
MKPRDVVVALLLCAAVPPVAHSQNSCDIAWDPPVQVSRDSSFTTLPVLAVSGDTVHLGWIGFDSLGRTVVRYARSTDGGGTFPAPSSPLSPLASFSAHLAADGDRVFIAADAAPDTFSGIVLVSSSDGGATWSAPVPVMPAAFPGFLCIAGRDLLLGFREIETASFGIMRSADAGRTWEILGRRMREIADVSVLGGRLHAVGPAIGSSRVEAGYYTSADTGRTWAGPSIVSPEDLVRSDPSRISLNGRGYLFAAWIDTGAVVFRYSRNSGISWGSWNPLGRGPGSFPLDLGSAREFVVAAWGLDLGGVRGIRARMSNDNGESFCPEVTPGGGDDAREPVIAVRDSIVHVAWIDESGGGLEVFYRNGLLPARASGGDIPPASFALKQSYPNPTNGFAFIGFDVPATAPVSIGVYSVLGELVMRLATRTYAPGRYVEPVDVGSLPSGVYFYRLSAPGFDASGKMVILR